MTSLRRAWIVLGVTVSAAFLVLGFFGREVYRKAPPLPDRVVTASGRQLFSGEEILTGQQVWQSVGGQQVGSVWGHGAYQAPDWSADWLHREATTMLDRRARLCGPATFAAAEAAGASCIATIREDVRREMRKGGFDEATRTVTVSEERAAAIEETAAHYAALFAGDPSLSKLRDAYALHDAAVKDPTRLKPLTAFFFWTSWSCAAERPGTNVSYTMNWPHEPLVGNVPTSSNVMWSMISIVLLLAGIGAIVAWHATHKDETPPEPPAEDPLARLIPTASMKAVPRYCIVVVALFVLQALLGALTAHYTVEGRSFFGFPLADWLPYAVTRTWHVQLGVFWIATAFLAAGLFLAPAIGGREPKRQRLGVNVLLGALFLVVGGSLAGEWFSVRQVLPLDLSFWFGHQGYEYVDLGRAFQIALYGGLFLWLFLMLRAVKPAFAQKDETSTQGRRSLVLLFTGATAAIGLFYGAGLLYGARTHLSVAEYWRWWVVHLWVEGFMEVFATAALAFLFSRLGLVRAKTAAWATLSSTAIFLAAGIPGTFHHLYFAGTPVSIMAVGAAFSALEVVPLVLLGREAIETMRLEKRAPWMKTYRWPLKFFAGTAFWNLVGAGIFGFLINPPIALYYMQGLNTTPVHGHTALFGVYGLLALGLVLLVLRKTKGDRPWREAPLRRAFWAMNIGLGLMVALSLLPIGLAQAWASVEHGLWFARSAEFLQQPWVQTLRWFRIVGDTVFLYGVVQFAWFVAGLWTGRSFESDATPAAPGPRHATSPARELAGTNA
jgi:nitric oxide reductase subunit B